MQNNVNNFNNAKIQLMRIGAHASDEQKVQNLLDKISMISKQHNRLIDILQKQIKVLELNEGSGLSIDPTGKVYLGLASEDTDGALTAEDWNIFNGKQEHSNELDALSALEDTIGFIRKTGDGIYEIDTSEYVTAESVSSFSSIWGAL